MNGSIEDVVSVQLHVAVQHGSAHQSSHNMNNMEEGDVQNLLIENSHRHLNVKVLILVHLVSTVPVFSYYHVIYCGIFIQTEDCDWEYRNCGDCSATCGTANRQCTLHITRQAKYGGRDCPAFVKSGRPRTLACGFLRPCPGMDKKYNYSSVKVSTAQPG